MSEADYLVEYSYCEVVRHSGQKVYYCCRVIVLIAQIPGIRNIGRGAFGASAPNVALEGVVRLMFIELL